MTWYPIAFLPTQYENTSGLPYSGAVLKAYRAQTTTVIPMATSYTGATTANSFALNAAGYPVSGGSVIIPHIQEDYKLALYPNQASADANSGAVWTVDDIQVASLTAAERIVAFATDTGAADAYVIAPDPAISAYADGQEIVFTPANANTGAAATITVSGLSALSIKMTNGSNPYIGALLTTGVYTLVISGGQAILQNPSLPIATTANIVSGTANKFADAAGISPLLYLTKLSQSAGQSITTGTWTALNFDTEAIDDGSWHSASVNTNRITPNVAGWYEVIGSVAFNTSSNARVAVGIAKNGTLGVTASTYIQVGSNDIGDTVSEIVQMNGTTDYVEIQAYHNNGSSISTLTSRTSFSVRRVK